MPTQQLLAQAVGDGGVEIDSLLFALGVVGVEILQRAKVDGLGARALALLDRRGRLGCLIPPKSNLSKTVVSSTSIVRLAFSSRRAARTPIAAPVDSPQCESAAWGWNPEPVELINLF